MAKSGWIKTSTTGVRYREHPTRKHGKKPDRYFSIRYKLDGRDREEGLGWGSSEEMTQQKAAEILTELKKNQRKGTGPRTLAEKRAIADAKRQAEAEATEQAERDAITIKEFFNGDYMTAQAGKAPTSITREKQLFEMFIAPAIGNKAFREVSPFDIEKIKSRMVKTDRSGRTIQYCLAVVRQIFNTAKFHGLYEGDAPTAKVKRPKFDNKRLRHLTEDEVEKLLAALKVKSINLYRQAILSLYAGLRFGEIASLSWGDVDSNKGLLTLRDTKAGNTRHAFFTERIKTEVFDKLEPGKPDELIFPDRKGRKAVQVSSVFLRTVKELGLNDEITDPRQKVCFHSLRHTFASWCVERGVDLFQVSKLLGHSTIALTERYSHLRPGTLQEAVKVLDQPPTSMKIEEADKAVNQH